MNTVARRLLHQCLTVGPPYFTRCYSVATSSIATPIPSNSNSNSTSTSTSPSPISSPLLPPIKDQIRSLIHRLVPFKPLLPSDIWLRLFSASQDQYFGPLKILVVADRHVGRGALINSLLNYPDGKHVINETWGSDLHQTFHLVKGNAWRDELIDQSIRKIQVPAPLLNESEWTIIPPLPTGWPQFIPQLSKHNLVLLVTDTPRHLSTENVTRITQILCQCHYPTFVAINGIDYLTHEKEELPLIVTNVRNQIGPNIPVHAVSTRRYAVAHYLGSNDPTSERTSQDTSSGIPALATSLRSLIDNPMHRTKIQTLSNLAVMDRAVSHLIYTTKRSRTVINHMDVQFTGKIIEQVVRDQERVMTEFHNNDLQKVSDALSRMISDTRNYFATKTFWRLFWNSDHITHDLRSHLRFHWLSEAEQRMALAIGRLSEALRYLYRDTDREIKDLYQLASNDSDTNLPKVIESIHDVNKKSPYYLLNLDTEYHSPNLSTDAAIAPMLTLLDRFHVTLEQDVNSLARVDAFVLSNIVWRYRTQFEEVNSIDQVRVVAEQLALRTGVSIVVSWVATILVMATSIVDPIPALSGGAVASLIALFSMQRGWSKFETEYVRSLTTVEEGLRKDLLDQYHKVVHDKLTIPMSNLVEQYEKSSGEQLAYLDEQETVLIDIKDQLQIIRQKVEQQSDV